VQLAERKQSYLRWGQAEAFYHRAWGLDSRDFTIAEKMADLFAARSTWNATQRTLLCAEAIRWYDRSLTHNPFNFDAVIKKARIYDVAGNKDKALEYFQQAVAARPRRAAYQTELGLHHLRWQDTEAARKAFQQALKIDPADERAALQLQALTLPAEKS
jgi:Tfp pilus assembly protein PilF